MTLQDTFDALKYRIEIDNNGTRRYYNAAGALHREDGPACEYTNGSKEWFVNGERHRTDGPAVVWPDGTMIWYVNGMLHCVDGPAIEDPNGRKWWYINNIEYTESEFNALVKK